MVRVLVYVAFVFLLAAGFAWLADRPGDLLITWQGYEIRASLMVAAIAAAILLALIAIVWTILRSLLRTPRAIGHFVGARRRDRGYRALSTGMIAVGAGDVRTARRSADESRALLGEVPLTLLLTAQAAQLSGDGDAARKAFESLSEGKETRILGLHGLFVEARRQGEHDAARHFAEEAMRLAPRIGWAGSALFEYQARAGDWSDALNTLDANTQAGLVDKKGAKRLRAVLLTAMAMEHEQGEPEEARPLALEAQKLAPDLPPAALIAARLLARDGNIRRATRILEAAWKAMPHPEIADAYAHVRPGDAARDRLKRIRRLNELRANHAEGAMALARAAIDAGDWMAARGALEGLVRAGPSERVCLLMAEIEEKEHGDQGRIRAWLTRAIGAPRDPAWVADGHAFDHWAPVSPISGRVDAFEWTVVSEPPSPLAALEIGEEQDEPETPAILPPEPDRRSIYAEAADDVVDIGEEPEAPTPEPAPRPVTEPTAGPKAEMAATVTPSMAPEAAIEADAASASDAPLPDVEPETGPEEKAGPTRAPDDPGPDPADETLEKPARRFGLF